MNIGQAVPRNMDHVIEWFMVKTEKCQCFEEYIFFLFSMESVAHRQKQPSNQKLHMPMSAQHMHL